MVPNFQPRRRGIVINNYFNCKGGIGDCNCNVINTNKGWDKYGYINLDFKIEFLALFLYIDWIENIQIYMIGKLRYNIHILIR